MATFVLLVSGRSPSQVGERLGEQIATGADESSDPLRYHGAEIEPGVFELRRYAWEQARGGPTRNKYVYRLELRADAGGTRVLGRLDERGSLVAFGVLGFLPLLLIGAIVAAGFPHADARATQNVMHALPFMLGFPGLFGVGLLGFGHAINVINANAERDFLRAWLGARPA